jgi:CBS domain containing-hemolysin-like protein
MSIKDFNDRFQAGIPLADEYETIGGLVQKVSGRIPEVGEEVATSGFSFTVIKKSQRRIRIVKVKRTDGSRQLFHTDIL